MLSAILGGVVNKALGKSADVGIAVGQYGTKWNNEFTYIEYNTAEEIDQMLEARYAKMEEEDKQKPKHKLNALQKLAFRTGVAAEKQLYGEKNPVLTHFFKIMKDGDGSRQHFGKNSLLAKELSTSAGMNKLLKKIGRNMSDGETKFLESTVNFAETEGGLSDLGSSVGKMAVRLGVTRYGNVVYANCRGIDRSNYEYHTAEEIENWMTRIPNNLAAYFQSGGAIKPFTFDVVFDMGVEVE